MTCGTCVLSSMTNGQRLCPYVLVKDKPILVIDLLIGHAYPRMHLNLCMGSTGSHAHKLMRMVLLTQLPG